MKSLLKSLSFFLVFFAFNTTVFAQTNEVMIIEKTDNSTVQLGVDQVKRVYFKTFDHEFVDLGLPSGVKWATTNVGANAFDEYGDFYAWGETKPKTNYTEANYDYYKNGAYISIGTDISGTQYDVAHVKWGENWCMPTMKDFQELVKECTWTWTTQYRVNGYIVKGKNNKTIFLPAAGSNFYGDKSNQGKEGLYWASISPSIYDPTNDWGAVFLKFDSSSKTYNGGTYRFTGCTVRPVYK